MAISGDYAVVGALLEDGAVADGGAAYLYEWDAQACEWVNVDKLLPQVQPGVVAGVDLGTDANDPGLVGEILYAQVVFDQEPPDKVLGLRD